MIIPKLSDTQQDQVVQSLQGSTLVELLRASIQGHDQRTLQAIERNGALDLAFLTAEHADMAPDFTRHPVMDQSLTPMLDALGQVLVCERDSSWAISLDLATWLARHTERNLNDVAQKIDNCSVPLPDALGVQLRVRQHLCALGCLAVAADQPELVARINKIDPKALFMRMHSDLIERAMGVHAISPWGLAVRLKRSEILIGQFDPRKIEEPLAIETHHDSEYDINAIELLTRRNDTTPDASEMTMWLIRAVSTLKAEDWKQSHPWEPEYGEEKRETKQPSAELVSRICRSDGEWSPIAEVIMTEVPEFFRSNFRDCLEAMAGSRNMELLGRFLHECVDWKKVDNGLNLASENKHALKFIPFDHPLGIVTDATQDSNPAAAFTLHALANARSAKPRASLDDTMLLVLQAMKESDTLSEMMSNRVSLNEDALCFAHEIAQKGLVKSLGFLLQAGMDHDLKNKEGLGLIEFCEQKDPNGPVLPLLRACAAAACVNDLLSNHARLNQPAHASLVLGR